MATLSDYGSPVAGIVKCMIDNFSKAARLPPDRGAATARRAGRLITIGADDVRRLLASPEDDRELAEQAEELDTAVRNLGG